MIDSILFCKDGESRLIFNGLCENPLIYDGDLSIKKDSFFIDKLSFKVESKSGNYLLLFPFGSKNSSVELGSESSGRIFVRSDWLAAFGANTMFSKFNIKKDYVFNCQCIRDQNSNR